MHLSRKNLLLSLITLIVLIGYSIPVSAQYTLLTGIVELRRGRSEFRRINSIGYELKPDDLLKLSSEARATIQCRNSTMNVPRVPKSVRNICLESHTTQFSFDGRGNRSLSDLDVIPGGSDPQIPYVISPRKTWLLSNQPTLRWNSVPGTTRYVLQIEGKGVNWKQEVDGTQTQFVYPGDQPLMAAENYTLTVEAINDETGESVEDIGLEFSLLSPEYAQSLQQTIQPITKQNLPKESEVVALVNIYLQEDYELFAEAIEQLEMLVDDDSQTSTVYNNLGALYGHVGLNLLAEDRYLKAEELASKAENLDGQVTAQVGLGKVYVVMENLPEAIQWLDKAVVGYEQMEDSQRKLEFAKNIGEAYASIENGLEAAAKAERLLNQALRGYIELKESRENLKRSAETDELADELSREIAQISDNIEQIENSLNKVSERLQRLNSKLPRTTN